MVSTCESKSIWYADFEMPDSCRSRLASHLFKLLAIFGCIAALAAHGQEWQYQATIEVGQSPDVAVAATDRHELYVANKESRDISAIDTTTDTRLLTIDLHGKSPKAMVISPDEHHLYVLLNDAMPDSCIGGTNNNWLITIDTATKTAARPVPLPGPRWDDMALASDGRLFITKVCEAGTFQGGVYIFDTVNNVLADGPVIQDQGCPVGIALAEPKLFVNYQCYGPEGRMAHDSIGVYQASPPYKRIGVIAGAPNVGGQLLVSPDRKQLWAAGNDACARLDYPVSDCPTVPSAIVNVFRTDDLQRIAQYGFSIEESNERMSFSPDGVAFIGGGIYLKEIPTKNGTLAELKNVRRLPIAGAGAVAFSKGGEKAYLVVTPKGVVQVMKRATPGEQGKYENVWGLSAKQVFAELGVHGRYGGCVEHANNTRLANCFRVPPQDLAPEIWLRADDAAVRACGYAAGNPENRSSTDVYRCTANAALTLALSGAIAEEQAIEWALELMALEANEENINWRANYTEYKRLMAKDSKRLTPREKSELSRLSAKYDKAENLDGRAFNDITLHLHDANKLRAALGNSAALISISSWGKHTYTLLTTGTRYSLQEDMYRGRPVDNETFNTLVKQFIRALSEQTHATTPPPEATTLYQVIVGTGGVADVLNSLESRDDGPKPTLVWAVEGHLIPVAALSPDGRHYLAETFASTFLTAVPTMQPRGSDRWEALAVGAQHGAFGLAPLPGVPVMFRQLFSSADEPIAGTMPADIRFDKAFNATSFSSALKTHVGTGHKARFVVFVASHFVFDPASEANSFLLTGDMKRLSLLELTRADEYPFRGVDLAVFSACSTAGSGDLRGLAYDLDQFGNGARSVLATLWSVDPDSSTKLLKPFNDEIQDGTSLAEALRRAEVSMRTQPPRYWAAYILLGDWH